MPEATCSFLFLVVTPGATSILLFVVGMPGATSSFLFLVVMPEATVVRPGATTLIAISFVFSSCPVNLIASLSGWPSLLSTFPHCVDCLALLYSFCRRDSLAIRDDRPAAESHPTCYAVYDQVVFFFHKQHCSYVVFTNWILNSYVLLVT